METFRELENFVGSQIPKYIKNILITSGFDCKLALMGLKSTDIAMIEDYVQNHRSLLDETPYENENENKFTFRPGHRTIILNIPAYLKDLVAKTSTSVAELCPTFQYLSAAMKSLLETAHSNTNKHPKANRYSEMIQHFSTYIFLMSGRSCYDTLCANLPIPKTETIVSYISQNKCRIVEGELRAKGLNEYLNKLGVQKDVWICEDATGIVSNIQLDPRTNQLVGIVLPLDSSGIPKAFSYLATSAEKIQNFLNYSKSTHVYLVLAQPLVEGVPPFILQLYGTNNTFKTEHVLKRWEYTVECLKTFGIRTWGFSADGDIRLLQCMRFKTPSISKSATDEDLLFQSQQAAYFRCIQDILHKIAKIRNRMIKSGIVLPMGNKIVSVSHLKILINSYSKDQHGLVMGDVCPNDHQNIRSVEKIMDARVLKALTDFIVDSEATVKYLNICSELFSAFYDDKLQPTERVYRIFHVTYFLRAWKVWIQRPDNEYKVSENFMTSNVESCVEVNAHNLVLIIRQLRRENRPDLFLPFLMNSQPCEESFRHMRSLGSVNYTKINFTLLELFHLVGRIELQNDIVYSKLANSGISFPRQKQFNSSKCHVQLPSDDEIRAEMQRAREDAIKDAISFRMQVDIGEIRATKLSPVDINTREEIHNEHAEDSGDDDVDHSSTLECSSLPDFSGEIVNIDNSGSYVKVPCNNGKTKVLRKSHLVWLLTDSKEGLSSDRLKRVQGHDTKNSVARQLQFKRSQTPSGIIEEKEIQIGNWCIFINDDSRRCNEKFLYGSVLGFQYIGGKTWKEKKYTWDYALVKPDPKSKNPNRGINVLALWYSFGVNGTLNALEKNHSFYCNIENYVATISSPIFKSTTSSQGLCFDSRFFENIREDLLKLDCKRKK